jgi:phosphoribosylanthranilate isomerase
MPGSDPQAMTAMARRLQLDIIQLHGDPLAADVLSLRSCWEGEIWAVVRGGDIWNVDEVQELFGCADAVVVDSGSRGTLGGTGQVLNWHKFSHLLAERGGGRLVLAGGLTHSNVASAIDALHPDVVDVSSGVESAVGQKDHEKMRLFMGAVLSRGEN